MVPQPYALRTSRWAIVGFAALRLSCAHASLPSGVTPSADTSITSLSPASGSVGTEVVVTGGGFTTTGNTVRFGVGYINNLGSSDGVTLRFTVPDGLNLCPPPSSMTPETPCPGGYPQVKPGSYSILVVNNNGSSGQLTFVVTAR